MYAQPLCDEGIRNSREWRQWSIRNHPDRGGEPVEYGKLSGCINTLKDHSEFARDWSELCHM